MRKIKTTETFEKDLKRLRKRGWNEDLLWKATKLILHGKKLPQKYEDHPLTGLYKGRRDCHIDDDWVLIYKNERKYLILERTGSHSDLFSEKQ